MIPTSKRKQNEAREQKKINRIFKFMDDSDAIINMCVCGSSFFRFPLVLLFAGRTHFYSVRFPFRFVCGGLAFEWMLFSCSTVETRHSQLFVRWSGYPIRVRSPFCSRNRKRFSYRPDGWQRLSHNLIGFLALVAFTFRVFARCPNLFFLEI